MGNKSKGTSNSSFQGVQSCLIVENKKSPLPRCGLYVINPDILNHLPEADLTLPLSHISYGIEVVNNLAKITLSQTYKNLSNAYLQAEYSFPIDPKAIIHKFNAKFGDVVISGIVKEKSAAKLEYTQAVKQGRQAAYAEIDQKSIDIMRLKVGNIPPKTDVVVQFQLVQELQVQMNTFYKLRILSNITPRYINDMASLDNSWVNKVKAWGSTLTLQKPNYTWGFDVKLKSSTKITFCNSSSHALLQTNINQTKTETDFQLDGTFVPNKDFVFVYSNELMMTSTLGITDAGISAALSFVPKFAQVKLDDAFLMMQKSLHPQVDIENIQGQYIFILDRSGSMSGVRISKALEALKFFLKSLPPRTIFNIVSFGNQFKLMFPSSVENNDDNIKKALSELSKFQADMGGTAIEGALKQIYDQKVRPYYPRQLFLLTDGDVSNTDRVINLVAMNVKFSRCHTIGIGNGCSHALIKGCAEKGKGKSIFINDGLDVAQPIIQLLQQSLTPVVSQFSLDYDTSVVDIIVPNPNNMPFILKNQPVNFYVVFKPGFQGSVNFKLKYTQTVRNVPYENTIVVNTEDNEMNFPLVDKIAYHKIISVLLDKRNKTDLSDQIVFPKGQDLEKRIVSQSIKHQVLCPLTAFICVGRKLVDGELVEFQEKGSSGVVVPQYISEEDALQQKKLGRRIVGPRVNRSSRMLLESSAQSQSFRGRAPKRAQRTLMQCQDEPDQSNQQMLTCINSYQPKMEATSHWSKGSPQKHPQPLVPKNCISKSSMPSPSMPPLSMSLPSMPLPSMPAQYMMMPRTTETLNDLKQLKSKASKQEPKKSLNKNQSPQELISMMVNEQKTDGSWEPTEQLITKLFPNQLLMTTFHALSEQFQGSFVLTCVVAAWIQENYNTPSYSLILKKAQSWLNKRLDQYKLQNLTPITQNLRIGTSF